MNNLPKVRTGRAEIGSSKEVFNTPTWFPVDFNGDLPSRYDVSTSDLGKVLTVVGTLSACALTAALLGVAYGALNLNVENGALQFLGVVLSLGTGVLISYVYGKQILNKTLSKLEELERDISHLPSHTQQRLIREFKLIHNEVYSTGGCDYPD